MNTKAKLNERLAFSSASEWVPMADYRQAVAFGQVAATSPETDVTVQLRKATDASGTNADDLGSPVTAPTRAQAQAYASEIGETSGGVPFTHVSAVITGGGSPPADATSSGVIRGDGRFNP